jgi:hypothetical protein
MPLLTRILTLLGVYDAPDPAWKPTGYRCTCPGHNEETAVIATARSQHLADQRRKLAAVRSHPPKLLP